MSSVLHCSALEKIIVSGYKALSLIYFFTTGKDEVKAWTIQVGVFFSRLPRSWLLFKHPVSSEDHMKATYYQGGCSTKIGKIIVSVFIIMIIMYIYQVLINTLSAHMIHINLNTIY